MDEFERVQERLTRVRPTLSPTLRRAAAYMLEHPADVVTMSMRELARAADIPAPNFSRLAQQVGFEAYSKLRAVYRQRVHTGRPIHDSTPGRVRPPPTDAENAAEALWDGFRQAALANLAAAFDNVGSALAASLTDDLRSCNRIYVAATRAPHFLARYLHTIGNMATPTFRLIGRDTGSFGDDLVDLAANDALICLASTTTAESAVRIAEMGRERGALVIGITESRTTPLAAVSDRLLLVPVESPSFFRSHVGALAVVEMLVGFIMAGAGEAAAERIARIEAERRRFAEE